MTIEIIKDMAGTILDVGGGGECVIGQIYRNNVIAIDNSQDELDEAPDCCEKLLMDAAELSFSDNSFDNVTFFYSLMYMGSKMQKKAISEAVRVLKPGGMINIWDTDISSAFPEPHVVSLDIVSEQIKIHTAYGIVKNEIQDSNIFLRHLEATGQKAACVSKGQGQFFIRCKKA